MKSFYTILFCLLMVNLNAQDFTLTASTGTYTELVGATIANGDQTWDEPDFEGFPIENIDPVTILGISFNILAYIDNGIRLVSIPAMKTFEIAFQIDLCDRAFDIPNDMTGPGSISPISILKESGITKVQFKNAGFFDEMDDGSGTDFINFQLWVYNTSGKIEMHFGPNNIENPSLSYDDETGILPWMSLFTENSGVPNDYDKVIILSGNTADPTINHFDDIPMEANYMNGTIPDGTIYTFTPSSSTATTDVLNENSVRVFPNPATEVLNVTTSTADLKMENYTILNPQGQQLTRAEFTSNQINIAHLATGLYILKIETSEGVVTKKFFAL